MAQPPSRDLIAIIFKNFINSLKPRQIKGTLKGTDQFGNRYYEIPADRSIGKRKSSRWFEPPEKDNFEHERSSEWDAWLRGRRLDPPTPEELERNFIAMKQTKLLASQIDKKGGEVIPLTKGMESFPSRPQYEVTPGYKPKK